MKKACRLTSLFIAGVLLTTAVGAQEIVKPRWFTVDNRLRLEYDDNYSTTEDNEQTSFKVIEQIQFIGEMNLEKTFFSLRLQPSYIYWSDRDDDSDDLHHEGDLLLTRYISPKLELGLTDTLRISELPEVRDDRGAVLRQDNEYFYNSVGASLAYWTTPRMRVRGSVRYFTLIHADDEVANKEDYDLYGAGFTLNNQVTKQSSLTFGLRGEIVDYPKTPDAVVTDEGEEFIAAGGDRSSDSISLSAGLNHDFSPNLVSTLSAGYSRKEFENANTKDVSSPQIEGSLTFLPSPATRLSTGVSYGLYEADVYPFANQKRASAFISLAHDMTEKISWYLSTTVINGEYAADETIATVDDEEIRDGSDRSYLFSARIQYQIFRNNALEAGWQFSKLDTDLREEFTRNRFNVGWKLRL